jgi:hypothetical protein
VVQRNRLALPPQLMHVQHRRRVEHHASGAEMPTIRLAVAGDLILTRDLQAEIDDELIAVAEVLRGADCAIANLELPLHDFTSAASVAPGGFWLGALPERAEDLAWFGISFLLVMSGKLFSLLPQKASSLGIHSYIAQLLYFLLVSIG